MRVIPLETSDVTAPELAAMAKHGSVILTRKGKPVAAVKDLAGSDWESVALANNPKFIALIERSRASYREKGGIPLGDIRKELGLKSKSRASHARKKSSHQ